MATDQLHEAFRKAVRMEIEVEREFNFYLRPVTVTVDGRQQEVLFDSAAMNRSALGGVLLPIEFSISIKAVQKTRFAIAAQNELMLHLLDLGVIPPDQAIALMEFDGKEQVLKNLESGKPSEEPAASPKFRQKEKRNAV